MALPLPHFERLPCPTVLLLHELPDGSAHIDWMIAREPEARQPLVTFRIARRLDRLKLGEAIDAERIGDHRPAYLNSEGEISDGRGRVRLLCRGEILAALAAIAPAATAVDIGWREDAGRAVHQRMILAQMSENHFRITCETCYDAERVPPAALTKEES